MDGRSRQPGLSGRRRAAGFSLVELVVVMSILVVVMSLVISVAGGVIEANRKALQRASFEILDRVLDGFASQNPLRVYRNETGMNEDIPAIRWSGFFNKYPPINLAEVEPPLNSGKLSESIYVAGRSIHQRIEGKPPGPIPPILPGAVVRDPDGLAGEASRIAFDDTESFLFYVNYFAPGLAGRLGHLADGMIVNRDGDWVDLGNDGDPDISDIELMELRDVWGRPVLYINDCRDRFNNITGAAGPDGRIDNPLVEANNGKPVFVSAGPDGYFSAEDLYDAGADPPSDAALDDNIYSLPGDLVDRIDRGWDQNGPLTSLLRYDHLTDQWKPR
jgi:prepilin-type N-terminal cleavage/methylation domain-containing protein